MALSNELISQFAKIASDKKKAPTETTVYGTTVMRDGKPYVKLDGSDLLTPVQTTSSVGDGDRVTVMIKNHTATVMGNTSDPSASSTTVKDQGSKITEFEIVMAYKVSTQELEAINATIERLYAKTAVIEDADIIKADIEQLYAKFADLDHVTAKDMEVINATIENIEAKFAEIGDLTVEELEAINAEISNLKGYTADFTYVSADILEAFRASIKELEANQITTKDLEAKYANIDFANIGEAAIKKLFSDAGIIKDLVMSEGHITGQLVGVTIIGDLIEGGTVKADKLVVLGEDGLYYKLNVNAETVSGEQTDYNSLNGKIITAKSITAEKVNVNDLVAFDATIGGFNITDRSLYSGVKQSVVNTTRGVYLDREGQIAFGDASNFIRYYRDVNGEYKLEISAANIRLRAGGSDKDLDDVVQDTLDNIEIGGSNLIRNSDTLIFDNYYFEESIEDTTNYLIDENSDNLLDEFDDLLIV